MEHCPGNFRLPRSDGSDRPYQIFASDDWYFNLTWDSSGNLEFCERESDDCTYEYTEYENKCNVDFIEYYLEFFAEGDLMDRSVFKSVVGTYLPSKGYYSFNSYPDELVEFTYKFDKDGYPTEIKMNSPDSEDWNYIYKITY